jgi:hypothetical protein
VKPRISIRKALSDDNLLGNALPGPTWRNWRILLIALMGEALLDDERPAFREMTGRDREAGFRVEEFVAVIGRRGGKSRGLRRWSSTYSDYVIFPNWCQGKKVSA